MLRKGEPTGTALESYLRKQRHNERLGRRLGWGLGPWKQQKTLKGDTETISWWGGGDVGKREMWQTRRRNEITEKWALRAEGWGGLHPGAGAPLLSLPPVRGTGHQCGHLLWLDTLPPASATLDLNKVGWWALGEEEPVPQVSCLGVNSCCFP